MTNLPKQARIQQGLQEMLDKKRLSQNELARMTDVSAANISHILNGRTDKTISEEIWNRAAAPLGDLDDLRLIKTGSYNTVVRECDRTREARALVCLLGEAGYGKTSALRHYFLNTPNVYFVEFWYSLTRKEFFSDVARALAVDLSGRPTLAQLIQRCADKLNSATGSLLIVDEVSTMQPEKLNYLRELRERTRNNAGILLAGVPYFRQRLEKHTANHRDGVPEMVSRIAKFQNLAAPTKAELTAVGRANGLSDAEAKTAAGQATEYRVLSNWIKHQRPTTGTTA